MAPEPILEIDHLIKRVGQGENEITILQGVGLVVEPEETIALVGSPVPENRPCWGLLPVWMTVRPVR